MAIPEAIARKVEAGERLTRAEGVALLRDGDLLELGALADSVRERLHPEGRRHLHRRPQHQLHEHLHRAVRVLRVLPRPALEGGLPPLEGAARAEDRGDDRAGRVADPAPGRPASRPRHRVLRGAVRVDEVHLSRRSGSTASARPRSSTSAACRTCRTEAALRRLVAAGLDSIPGGGAEVLSDRVREIIGIAKGTTADWLEVMEVAHGLGMKTTATMMFGHVETLEERDRPPRPPARPAGPHGRVHRLHRLDLPALEHGAGRGRADVVPVPAHAGRGARDARQLPERAGLLGHAGREDRPGLAALRRQRLRLPDDRGERGLRGGRALPADRGRDRPQHHGRGVRAQAARPCTTRSWAIRIAGRTRSRRCPRSRPPPRRSRASALFSQGGALTHHRGGRSRPPPDTPLATRRRRAAPPCSAVGLLRKRKSPGAWEAPGRERKDRTSRS